MVDFKQHAAALEQRLDAILTDVLARLDAKLPAEGPRPGPSLQRAIEASLAAELRSFRDDPTPGAQSIAAVTEGLGLSDLELLISSNRLSQSVLWEHWFSLVEAAPSIHGNARRDLLTHGSGFFYAYADLLGDALTAAYRQALEEFSQDTKQRRLRAVRSVLAGRAAEPAADSLNFDLDQHHLGVVAWGEDASAGIRDLAALLERPSLATAPVEGALWGWVSGSRPFSPADERALLAYCPPANTSIAIGLPDFGEEGFRASHRQAQLGRWASRFSPQPIVRYADVAVVALAAESRDEARRFVARELRGIDDDSTEARRIRETLIAYFTSDQNAASAAARLGVHQQTVANRLRGVEERLGRSVGARRLELELALRLRACLGDPYGEPEA